MIELAIGLVALAVGTVVFAAIGEAWSHITEGFGCMDFGEAVGTGFGVVVVVALVLIVSWLLGMAVMVLV